MGGIVETRRNRIKIPNDLQIARKAPLQPLPDIAADMGIERRFLEPYGDAVAKVKLREVIETGAEAGEYEDAVVPGDRPVGRVTSSTMGHSVEKMLAMAYVETAHSWPGNNLVVEGNGRPIPARVAQTPFFDPENARTRSEPQEDGRRSEPRQDATTNSRSKATVGRSFNGGSGS